MVFEFQTIQKVGVNIATVFVNKEIVAIIGHRIIVWFLTVGFLQKLGESKAFGSNGFVELEIQVFLLQTVFGHNLDFA